MNQPESEIARLRAALDKIQLDAGMCTAQPRRRPGQPMDKIDRWLNAFGLWFRRFCFVATAVLFALQALFMAGLALWPGPTTVLPISMRDSFAWRALALSMAMICVGMVVLSCRGYQRFQQERAAKTGKESA